MDLRAWTEERNAAYDFSKASLWRSCTAVALVSIAVAAFAIVAVAAVPVAKAAIAGTMADFLQAGLACFELLAWSKQFM